MTTKETVKKAEFEPEPCPSCGSKREWKKPGEAWMGIKPCPLHAAAPALLAAAKIAIEIMPNFPHGGSCIKKVAAIKAAIQAAEPRERS